MNGLLLIGKHWLDNFLLPADVAELAGIVTLDTPPMSPKELPAHPAALAQAEIIFTTWGMPKLDDAFLTAAPKLKAVFYAAGSVRGFVTDASWERGIRIFSAYAGNAVPVAEYTVATALLSLKRTWTHLFAARQNEKYLPKDGVPGAYGSTIGLISLGMVARAVLERLRPFDLRVIAYDPFVTPEEAQRLGVTLVPLDTLFREADVVSLHTPWLKETEGLITGAHISSMKPGATFINTARGAVVRETEMIAALQQRPDLNAVLDVTYPEPPGPNSPLWKMPNVFLTPHIAGSIGPECRRMGRFMLDELRRYRDGQPPRWEVTRELAARLA